MANDAIMEPDRVLNNRREEGQQADGGEESENVNQIRSWLAFRERNPG